MFCHEKDAQNVVTGCRNWIILIGMPQDKEC